MADPQDAPTISLEVPPDVDPSAVAHVMFTNPRRMLVAPSHAHDVLAGRRLHRSDVKPAMARPQAALGVMNEARPFQVVDGIAVYQIRGSLSRRGGSYYYWSWQGYDEIVSAVEQALGAKDVRALLLVIDSPGGEAAGCFDATRKMRALKAAAGKPIVAYVDELAASAAYAIASTADEIIVPDTGEVGSIGVILSLFEYSKAFEIEGIKPNIITSGKLKATGHYAIEMSEAQREAVQRDIDHLAEVFAAEVVEGRGESVKQWLSLEADTRFGSAAVEAKLADAVGDLSSALARANALAGSTRRKSATSEAAVGRAALAMLRSDGASPISAELAERFAGSAEHSALCSLAATGSEPAKAMLRTLDAALSTNTTIPAEPPAPLADDSEGARAGAGVPPSPGVTNVMSNIIARSALVLALCASLSVSATTPDEELQKKLEERDKAQAQTAAEQAELFKLLGATDAASARTQIRELQLDRENLTAKLAAEKLAADKAEAERKALAEQKAKADAEEKERLIAEAHKRGLLAVSHADLLRDAAFSLDRVKAEIGKLDARGPVTGKPLAEAKDAPAASVTEKGELTWNGKTFAKLDSKELIALSKEDAELYERMLAQHQKRNPNAL